MYVTSSQVQYISSLGRSAKLWNDGQLLDWLEFELDIKVPCLEMIDKADCTTIIHALQAKAA